MDRPPSPPAVREVVDVYHGVEVTDPYRYMEDLENPAVVDWMRAQSEYARSTLDRISGRQGLIEKMYEFDGRMSDQIHSLQITDTDRHFYQKRTPDDEVAKLYCRDRYEGEEALLFDPSTYRAEEGLSFSITGFAATRDGTKVALAVAPNGSESAYVLILDVERGELYPEEIDRGWGPPSWLSDGSGFLYNRFNSTDVHDANRMLNTISYHHRVGTDPLEDRVVLSAAAYPELGIKPEEVPWVVFDTGVDHMIGIIATTDRRINAVMAPASELEGTKISWRRIFRPEDEVMDFSFTPSYAYVLTSKEAPNYTLLRASFEGFDLSGAEVLVPESGDRKLDSLTVTADGVYFVRSLNDVEAKLHFIPHGGTEEREIELPRAAGSLYGFAKGIEFGDFWVHLTGWTTNWERHRFDLPSNTFTRQQMSTIADYPEYGDLLVEEVLVASHDGAEVPLSLIYKTGTPRDGSTPTLILGYGAYAISMKPGFFPNFLLWTNEGGILAVAHVRGGGEKGHAWHEAGRKSTKPNTWKDLIACAEHLVENGYTVPGKIAISGGSAGGILVGRAMTERPDLFAAVISEVGVMNTLRTETSPNGPGNTAETGTVQDPEEAMALMEMDSYLKVRDGTGYPATLVTAGINDPRVIAWQPAKFAARLMAANTSEEPILLRVDFEAGHGFGETKSTQFGRLADVQAFALWRTGHPGFMHS